MNTITNIVYENSSNAQKLDLYFPDNAADKKFPLIFFIHGGGFSSGDKDSGTIKHIVNFNTQNFVIASVNYRLSTEAPFPLGIEDCEKAINFLLSHREQYHLNSKIAIAGVSSGANYALMLGINKSIISKFDKVCIVALYPVIDLLSLKNYAR